MDVQYCATLISIDGGTLTEGSWVDCQSRTSRRCGRSHHGGVIKSIRDNGRSYVVETDGGAAYLRNRRYIKASTATARRNVVGASIAAVDKGKNREGVRFKLRVRFEKPPLYSQD